MLCEVLFQELWLSLFKDVGTRRKYMSYLVDQPLDLRMTRASLEACPAELRTFLVGILCGAYRWQEGQRGGIGADGGCPFCLCPHAERCHLWWSCPATAPLRSRFSNVCRRASTMSNSLRLNGHPMLGLTERVKQARDFENLDKWQKEILDVIEAGPGAAGPAMKVYTDGSCFPLCNEHVPVHRTKAAGWCVVRQVA